MELVVAIIQTCKNHPDASHLTICEVFDGSQSLQIVCEASNIKAGMKTILAPIGSLTPAGLLIKEAILRGITSRGMLCSAKDLDVSNEEEIIDLPLETPVGATLKDLPLEILSSIPWHTYKLVDSLWENKLTKKLLMVKKGEALPPKNDYRLLSQTFFENNQYIYRHFKV
jgi:tRNA-binding EMAP/Myf-like protein